MSSPCTNARMPQIIAHRGASFDAPENTLAAVRLGWEQKADAVEIDIHLSRDGRIVVIHDDTTSRTSGIDGRIAAQSFDALRELDAGGGEKIPELAEVIDTVPAGKKLFIEIKCGPEMAAPLLRALLASGKPPSQFVVIAFSFETLLEVKKALPEIETYWLVGTPASQDEVSLLSGIAELIQRALEGNLQGLNLHYEHVVHTSCVSLVHEAGLECYAWTVDSDEVALVLKKNEIDGITTNRPGWLRERLRAE